MNMKQKTNSTLLHIWIAENGDHKAREVVCSEAGMTTATLSRILRGHMPKFEIRYRIYKLTGVKLNDADEYPDPAKVQAS